MSKKKPAPAPPTVLVITLESDGNASLLTRRGDLAHLSQFTYHNLQEIMAAIQEGAGRLIALEANPPPIDKAPAPKSEAVVEPETPTTSDEAVDTANEPTTSAPEAESLLAADGPAPIDTRPQNLTFLPKPQQAKLL